MGADLTSVHSAKQTRKGPMKASVVINTFNRAGYLANAVHSIGTQSFPDVELIVVNGPSTDDTSSVLGGLRERGYDFKLLNCSSRNLSESRNIGIAAAAGDVVLFIDDDAVAHPRWVERIMRPYLDESVGAVGGFTIDHTGMAYQCCYTVCDLLGNASFLSTLDPARLLETGTGFRFPSLLGTNCSFRRTDLSKIGGFDEVFAYLLDETDVCLRLFRARRRIVTVPDALVLHKYAPSQTRTAERIPSSLLAPARSKTYFMLKHQVQGQCSMSEIYAQIDAYRKDIDFSNRWFLDHKKISVVHYDKLSRELNAGIAEGMACGVDAANMTRVSDHLSAVQPLRERFLPIRRDHHWRHRKDSLRIYFVSQGYPPRDTSGIARWTYECAQGLAELGHEVHVVTRSAGDVSFVDVVDGIWVHAVADAVDDELLVHAPVPLPGSIQRRAEAVFNEIRRAQAVWGVDVVSAPIWDVEGLLCAEYLDVPVVTSLHTTYQLALPFKPYWQTNQDYRRLHVNRVIAAESWLLDHSPAILGNSLEVVREIDAAYGVNLAARTPHFAVVPHGIEAPPIERASVATARAGTQPLRLLFVGRLEERKGPDTLLSALLLLPRSTGAICVEFVGQAPGEKEEFGLHLQALAAKVRTRQPQITLVFSGYLDDASLQRAYAGCDVFVAPSRFESFGLILIEAMRWRKPVVACDIGGMREVVENGVSGLLVPPGDADALAHALFGLIAEPARRAQVGELGYARYVERFTRQRMALALQDYLGSVVKAAGYP
jgi:glycogen synthase